MKKVNLRDLYPDVYKTDHFVEVTGIYAAGIDPGGIAVWSE